LNIVYHENPATMLSAVEDDIRKTDVVLDIGCGIVPMAYFRPKLHIMAEPFDEYRNVLLARHAGDKSVLVLKNGALEVLAELGDASIDSVFLLDVIEHLDKDVGVKVLSEVERVAREQVVVFTPLGFMPQHMEPGETDAWGLSGIEMQEHRSGWTPEDFGATWHFHVCKEYHTKNFRGEDLVEVFGAFFAICTPTRSEPALTIDLPDIRKPLPSELELASARSQLLDMRSQLTILQSDLLAAQNEATAVRAELVMAQREAAEARKESDAPFRLLLIKWYRGLRRLFSV